MGETTNLNRCKNSSINSIGNVNHHSFHGHLGKCQRNRPPATMFWLRTHAFFPSLFRNSGVTPNKATWVAWVRCEINERNHKLQFAWQKKVHSAKRFKSKIRGSSVAKVVFWTIGRCKVNSFFVSLWSHSSRWKVQIARLFLMALKPPKSKFVYTKAMITSLLGSFNPFEENFSTTWIISSSSRGKIDKIYKKHNFQSHQLPSGKLT